MRAFVYLNGGEDHWDGFVHARHSLDLTLAARTNPLPADRHQLSLLDDLFTELNVGGTYLDLAEHYRDGGNRSFSVGDVIIFDDDGALTGFACASAGWEPVDVEALQDARGLRA